MNGIKDEIAVSIMRTVDFFQEVMKNSQEKESKETNAIFAEINRNMADAALKNLALIYDLNTKQLEKTYAQSILMDNEMEISWRIKAIKSLG